MPADPAAEADDLGRYRVPVEKPVALRFDYFGDFVRELAANISIGGMFIRTTQPRPPGSRFDFEFKLGEDFTLIRGRGEVVWTRPASARSDRPSGMGVRYLELDPTSTRVIERMVAQHAAAGKEPFDLEGAAESGAAEPRSAAAETAAEVAAEVAARAAAEEGGEEAARETIEQIAGELRTGDDAPEELEIAEAAPETGFAPADGGRLDEAGRAELPGASAELARLRGEAEARVAVIEHLRNEVERIGAERALFEVTARKQVEAARRAEAETRGRLEQALQELGARSERAQSPENEAQEAAADEAVERLRRRVTELEEELARWSEAADVAKTERETLLVELEEARSERERERADVEAELAAALARGEELTREIERLRESRAEVLAELEATAPALADTRRELDEAGDRSEGLEQRIVELEAELRDAKASRSETTHELDETRAELGRLQAAEETARIELTAELESVREGAEARAVETAAEAQTAREEAAELASRLEAEEAGRREAEERVAALEKEVGEAADSVSWLEDRLGEAERRSAELAAHLEATGAAREEIESELAAAHRAAEAAAGAESAAAETRADLEGRLAAAESSRRELDAELVALRQRAEELETVLGNERAEAERLSRGDLEARARIEDLRRTIDELESGAAESALESQRLAKREEKLTRKVRKLEKAAARGTDGAAPGSRIGRWGPPAVAGLAVGFLLAFAIVGGWRSESPAEPVAEAPPGPAAPSGAIAEQPSSPEPPPEGSTPAPEPRVPALPPASEPSPSAPPAAPSPAADVEAARRAVEEWAAAWSAQDVDAYLGAYAESYDPPGGLDRASWAEQRRVRLRQPQFIRVVLDELQVEEMAPDRVRISFLQTYESDTFGDQVRKRLELVDEGGAWRIVSEASE